MPTDNMNAGQPGHEGYTALGWTKAARKMVTPKVPSLCVAIGALLLSMIVLGQQPTYVVTTLAGSPGNLGGSDGTNGDARFFSPYALAAEGAGNLYVTDYSAHTVRRLSPSGSNWIVKTTAGLYRSSGSSDGTNQNARFNYPSGIAVDAAGNVYIADRGNHTVRHLVQIGTNWVVNTIVGSPGMPGDADGTNEAARLNSPDGIGVDDAGNLFVADARNYTIRRIAPVGTNWVVTTLAGSPGLSGAADGTNSWARFLGPGGLAVGHTGDLFLTDNNAIRRVARVGTNWVVTTLAGMMGTYNYGWADGTNSDARFNFPRGIVAAGADLYVADTYNNLIRRVRPVGTNWVVTTAVGTPGTQGYRDGVSAVFDWTPGVALDFAGNIYTADYYYYGTIRMATPVSLQAARGEGQAVLRWPSAAASYFILETCPELPSGSWSPVTNTITISNRTCTCVQSLSSPRAFYRLRLK